MKKKLWIPLLIVVLVGVLAGGALAIRHAHNNKTYSTKGNASQKGTTKKTTSVTDQPAQPTVPSTNTNTSGSVAVGSVTPPANNAPYPIINEHYKISQVNSKQFDITLYAIINSPSQYDEYNAQLKQYKQEALSYLNNRYGSTNQFIINWDPSTANDL